MSFVELSTKLVPIMVALNLPYSTCLGPTWIYLDLPEFTWINSIYPDFLVKRLTNSMSAYITGLCLCSLVFFIESSLLVVCNGGGSRIFLTRMGQPKRRGNQPIIWPFFSKNCMKINPSWHNDKDHNLIQMYYCWKIIIGFKGNGSVLKL